MSNRVSHSVPKVDKDAAEVAVVLFHPVVQLADMRLIEETEDLFLELPAPFAGDDFDEIDLFVDRFLDDPVEFGIDLTAAVVDVVQIELEFCHFPIFWCAVQPYESS